MPPKQLSITSLSFHGIERMEPAQFDPSVMEYTVYRSKGTHLTYTITANLTAIPVDRNNIYKAHVPYPGFTTYVETPIYSRNATWSTVNTNHATLPYGNCDVRNGAYPDSKETTLERFCYVIHVVAAEMTPEERLACTHPATHTEEGQFWGGGSGSCTVEMNTYCNECGTLTSSYHEHRD